MFKKTILIIFLLISSLNASNKAIVINNSNYLYKDFRTFYLKDNNSTLNFQDILKKEFTKTVSNAFSLGYTKGNLWIKFDILNKSDTENFIITLNETFYEKANLYYQDKYKWIKKQNGLFIPLSEREVKYNKLSFLVHLKKDQKTTIYLELKGKYSYFGKIEIYKKDYFKIKEFFNMNIAFIFIFGVTFIILTFNIGMYIILRERIYLYYSSYTFFNLIYLVNISGLLVYVNLQKYIYDLHSIAAFLLASLLLFSVEYLNIKTYLPRYYTLIRFLSLPYIVVGVLLPFFYQPLNQILNFMAEFLTIFLIVLSLIVYNKGFKKSKYYTFTITVYLFFVVLFLFMLTGILEYDNITRYGLMIGSVIENIIFSLLIISRYNDIKNFAQTQLEDEVNIRTHEIKKINLTLESLLKERELLLKELYHRVKNNFHMITAMLWLEGKRVNNTKQFEQLINRVESMALVHEHLYSSDNLTQIDIKQFLNRIIDNSLIEHQNINLIKDYKISCSIAPKNAVSIGMILNELLTNSIKHNEEKKNLTIKITLFNMNQTIFFIYEDDGKGFDTKTHSNGLGINMIKDFCSNIPYVEFEFHCTKGMVFKLSFQERLDHEKL